MYHDTISITLKNFSDGITFKYVFLISKYQNHNFSPITYGNLLDDFKKIGFNTNYIKFKDIDDDNTIIYCTYNWQSNFNIFFIAYKKLLQTQNFDILISYGVIINGKYIPNNMNGCAEIIFKTKSDNGYKEEVIKGKTHYKELEFYQLIESTGLVIHSEVTTFEKNFEQTFFEKYEVKLAMRKYKLGRLKKLSLN